MKRNTKAKAKKIEEIAEQDIKYPNSDSEEEDLVEESDLSEEELEITEETKTFTQRNVYNAKELDRLADKLKGQFYNRLNSKRLIKRQGKVPFVEHLSLFGETIVALPENEAIHKDLKRELCFYNYTLQDAKKGVEMLIQSGEKIGRPNDFFAEMMKSDLHMKKIKAKFLKQEEKIKQFEEKRLRLDNKKFRKKIILIFPIRS